MRDTHREETKSIVLLRLLELRDRHASLNLLTDGRQNSPLLRSVLTRTTLGISTGVGIPIVTDTTPILLLLGDLLEVSARVERVHAG